MLKITNSFFHVSPDPTANSETTNPAFSRFFWTYQIVFIEKDFIKFEVFKLVVGSGKQGKKKVTQGNLNVILST